MTPPLQLFAPKTPARGEAFRPRRLLGADYFQRFGPAHDGFELFVSMDASDALCRHTAETIPAEASGLVVGRAFVDDLGPYLVVVAAAAARADYSDPGRVIVSGKELQRLKSELERRFPTADIVGWWHSHADLSGFSSVDQAEQATWQAEHHVGILTFQSGAESQAYRGPAATPLLRQTAAPPTAHSALRFGPRTVRSPAHLSRPGAVLFWSYVVGVVAIAALGVGLFSSRLPVKAAAQRPADLSWSCSPVPERLRCQGPVGPGVVSWHWSIDGDMVAAAHPLLDLAVRPGPHNVGLVIVSPAGSYSTRLHHVVIDNTPEADRETPR